MRKIFHSDISHQIALKRIFLLYLVCFLIIAGSFLLTPRALLADQIDIPPSLMLLGAGADWAAKKDWLGERIALYVNRQDNLYLHPNPYEPVYTVPNPGDSISFILEKYGFKVEFAGDIPNDLSKYSVVVITSYFASEPAKEPIIRDYIEKGGGVVLYAGVPVYFVTYSKDFWPGVYDLSVIKTWFGATQYVNTGGNAILSVDNPFGTSLKKGKILLQGTGYSYAGVSGLMPGTEVVAEWEDGTVFSFKYGGDIARVYYQAGYLNIETHEKPIIKMTVPEIQKDISEVKVKIIDLSSQILQIIREKINEIQAKIIELKSEIATTGL